MSSSVDQIKAKIDIVSLVSSYIKLEKAGANFKGKCPFHNEKTPSFFVSPDRGTYYCFGCQAKGDIFTFVQEFEGLDFIGSLKVLAEKAGVTLDHYNAGEKTEKQRLYLILEQAVFFYQKKLSEDKLALGYLHKRGVNDNTIKNFRLGLSSPKWRDLYDYLADRGITTKDMLAVGLIKQSSTSLGSGKEDGKYYDTFRDRIMFPISDSSGRVVGFSGRALNPDDKSPKYLNSPETVLFNKSEVLFGLDKAKKDIRIKDYSILVEGQMDLIMLHQVGITNTVASSGTALTENHLIKLRRLSNRIIMSYDGDNAGFSASTRSSQLVLSLGMELKLAVMPEGQDPADLAKDDVNKLKDCLKNSKHIIDFYVDSLLEKKLEPRKLGQEIQKKVLPFVALLTSTIEKAHFVKSVAQKTFIKEEALWDDLKRIEINPSDVQKIESVSSAPTKRIEIMERRILGVVMWQREKKDKTEEVNLKELEQKIERIFEKSVEKLEKQFQQEKDLLIFEVESYYGGKNDLNKDIDYLLSGLEEEYLKQKFTTAMVNLQKAEQMKNEEDIERYLKKCRDISQQINNLKNKSEH